MRKAWNMGNNVPLTPSQVTAPTGSPEDVNAPGVQNGFPGNLHDDDGIALDEYFEAADSGPEEYGGIKVPELEIPANNRLVISSMTFPAGTTQARQLLPADPNRKHLSISAYKAADGAVAGLLLASDSFSLPTVPIASPWAQIIPPVANYYIWYANLSFALATLDDYTGALWVLPFIPDPSTNNIVAQAMAVTS